MHLQMEKMEIIKSVLRFISVDPMVPIFGNSSNIKIITKLLKSNLPSNGKMENIKSDLRNWKLKMNHSWFAFRCLQFDGCW